MAWLQAGETWINMDQAVHVVQEGDDAVITFAVGLSAGTFPYAQRYAGTAANAIFAWLQTEATVEAAENALTLATMEDELEDELTESVMIVEIDDDEDEDDDDDEDDDESGITYVQATATDADSDDDRDDDDEEVLATPPAPMTTPAPMSGEFTGEE